MKERILISVKNSDTKVKVDSILKEKGISFNQFINDVLDDYFAQNRDKTYLQNINESMDY